jgi:uncharacterized membrane protein YhaH (DUF805 family)
MPDIQGKRLSMATDQAAQEFELLKRAITGSTDWLSRSRRTEFFLYWMIAKLVSVTILMVASLSLPPTALTILASLLFITLSVPQLALFARRINDQDRNELWNLLSVLSFLVSLLITATSVPAGTYGQLIAAILTLLTLILAALPGTKGPNRHGPDPRVTAK